MLEESSFLSQYNDSKPDCIIVCNRGPIEYSLTSSGTYCLRNSPGGVVTGLLGALQRRKAVWISLSPSTTDQQTVAIQSTGRHSMLTSLDNVTLHIEYVPQIMYQRYYDNISNRILWLTQHSLLQPTGSTTFDKQTQADWEQGYVAINTILAKTVNEHLQRYGPTTPVIFQDYHLYLAPAHVRKQHPHSRLSHFINIPWPDAHYFALLPEYMGLAIYQSLAANDIIGFQTLHDAQNFLLGAEYFLKARILWNIENAVGAFMWQNRQVQVRLYPVSIAPHYIQTLAESKEAEAAIEALSPHIRFDGKHQVILKVDRIDPIKNIIRGFQAYEQLLQSHPELQGKVVFLALLVPSRQGLAEYRSYDLEIRRIIDQINTRYGLAQWQPIVALFGNDRIRALACLQYYDVLLVNSVIDGMNLVVKEGGSINKRAGVIILSRTAGAHDTLGNHVLSITPLDIDATATALYRALMMPIEERTNRASKLRSILQGENAEKSLDSQIDALLRIQYPKGGSEEEDYQEGRI